MFKELAFINFCFFIVLLPSFIKCSVGVDFRDLQFAYRKDTPHYDGNETLFTSTNQSFFAAYGRCAVQCIEDLRCNALELCPVPGGYECRATTGLLKTMANSYGTGTCKQYIMDVSCGDDAFPDRRQDHCSDCDCVRQYKTKSGGYGLNMNGTLVFALCEFESNHSWTVIQTRHNGSVEFSEGWQEYANGFGSVLTEYWIAYTYQENANGFGSVLTEYWIAYTYQENANGFGSVLTEYWIGTEYIHQLTQSGLTTVRIDLEDYDGDKRYAEYSFFNVSDRNDNYRLAISGYSGTAGDSMSSDVGDEKADGEMFSTTERDNDQSNSNCAAQGRGGWWYGKCTFSSLNGEYENDSKFKGINWDTFRGMSYSLKISKMKLRRP